MYRFQTHSFEISELLCRRSHDFIVQNMRVASVRAARRQLVKLFKKASHVRATPAFRSDPSSTSSRSGPSRDS
jgi:hypothetical protein